MGASLALAGASACAPPREQIVPYVRPPQEVVPGKPLFFATAHVLGGFAQGVLVESHEGRPTKVEGNPSHPASLGATDAFTQASVLGLYDPSRSRTVLRNGQISTWEELASALRASLGQLRSTGGEGLRFVSGSVTSPTFGAQMQGILEAFPQARWHRWEPLHRDNLRAGAVLAFGQAVETRYHFEAADVILSLDGDPFASMPGHVRYLRDFAARRRPEQASLARVYAIESTPSLLGAAADHRLPMRARDIEAFAFALAAALGVDVGGQPSPVPAGVPDGWLEAVADDLRTHQGRALVVAGEFQPAAVHAVAHAINETLGGLGQTVEYSDPVEVDWIDHTGSLDELVSDMDAGRVTLLVVLEGNPAYTAPADIAFAAALRKVGASIHLGQHEDETAALCQWHVPALHALETWSDARAFDGTTTILQPLIAPLYGGHSAHELLALFSSAPQASSHDIVKGFWQSQRGGGDFDMFWRTSLNDGVVANTLMATRDVRVRAGWANEIERSRSTATEQNALEIVFRPDPSVYDGRFASNSWLQELPRPLTKLTWDTAALVSPRTAERLGVRNQDVVQLQYAGRTLEAPVQVLPGQADDSISLTLGYGRARGAGPGTGVGVNAYTLRGSRAAWFDLGLEVARSGKTYLLATTQGHYAMEGHELVVSMSADQAREGPAPAQQPPRESLYPGYGYPDNAWGMVIDLNACVGCNACIAACQAENNIPVVGKEEVSRGREMHWLRLDTYLEGDPNTPRVLQQLVPCMHCENAPCELVCPVGATVHSTEGLNDMVYNRCVGTRYCSNNCPYKVRHFNFFQYSDYDTASLKLLRNPNVTVRSRGVMEKCTYCVQRITAARTQAEKEDRPIRDGDVVTACQAACPANAIVFGNLNDPDSGVARQRRLHRNYTLLAELNTRPRTTYLAVVPNPNPALGADA